MKIAENTKSLPWWTWVVPAVVCHAGTQLSINFQFAPGVSLLYLPIPLAVAMIQWWGPRVLLGLFLNAMLCAGMWGLPRWQLWPLYALPETFAVFFSWLFFARLAKGKCWLPDVRQTLLFVVLAVLVAASFDGFQVPGQLVLLGDIPASNFWWSAWSEWMASFLGCLAVSVPLLVLLTPVLEKASLSRTSGAQTVTFIPDRKNKTLAILEFALVITALLILACTVSIEKGWFIFGVFAMWIALRFGIAMAAIVNGWIVFLSLLLPTILSEQFGFGWTHETHLVNIHLSLGILCLSALITARAISDIYNEIENRKKTEELVLAQNQQLKASQQQLRALNQQLTASEQQLRALNQQLIASEQQLRALNQQLMASEQQLKASNEHLRTAFVERKQILSKLKFKNNELQEIIYSASHDLRSPLVNIDGFSNILQADCRKLLDLLAELNIDLDKNDPLRELLYESIPESLAFITRSTKKMASLLDGLLRVSRVGSADIKNKTLNVNRIIDEVIASMEHQINERKAKITVDPLPHCLGDPLMMDHVFSNLIGNAVKYLDPARDGDIRITGRHENGISTYCVQDNGIGIDAGHHKKVFEIFHRLDPQGTVPGEGLGLTIVRRIMDRLDGSVHLESEPGKGSKFFISIPGKSR